MFVGHPVSVHEFCNEFLPPLTVVNRVRVQNRYTDKLETLIHPTTCRNDGLCWDATVLSTHPYSTLATVFPSGSKTTARRTGFLPAGLSRTSKTAQSRPFSM